MQLALWKAPDGCGNFSTFEEIAANDDGGDALDPYIQAAKVVGSEYNMFSWMEIQEKWVQGTLS